MFYILSNRGNYVVISIWIADYVLIKWMPNLENDLLCKVDFFGAALKFKARSNTLALNARIRSWKPIVDISCPLYNNDVNDLIHFLFLHVCSMQSECQVLCL